MRPTGATREEANSGPQVPTYLTGRSVPFKLVTTMKAYTMKGAAIVAPMAPKYQTMKSVAGAQLKQH
jgi:hypothetical protein